jgi:hypothetical protein
VLPIPIVKILDRAYAVISPSLSAPLRVCSGQFSANERRQQFVVALVRSRGPSCRLRTLLAFDRLPRASKAGLRGEVRSFALHLHSKPELDQAADGSLFRVFTTNEHARALGTDRLRHVGVPGRQRRSARVRTRFADRCA